jgi:hypothetical protein
MNWLPEHKCGLHLSHNEHKDVYESIQDFYDAKDFVSPEEYIKAIDENSVWQLQWYPETPVGFHIVAASSLEAIEQAVKGKST